MLQCYDSIPTFMARLAAAALALFGTLAVADPTPNYALLASGSLPTTPIFAGDPATQCTTNQFYDASGTLRNGTKICAPPEDCRIDGAAGCTATADFPSINLAAATPDVILANVSLGGVAGIAESSPADCNSDGQSNCVTTAAFPPIVQANMPFASIQNNTSIGGANGNFPTCDLDGAFDCAISPPYAAAATLDLNLAIGNGYTVVGISSIVPASPQLCAADGAINCVTTAGYPAAAKSNFAATDIPVGTTIVGVNGSLPVCGADGATACFATSSYRAVGLTGLAAKVLSGNTVAGVAGTIVGAPAPCATDGAIGCLATTAFPAASVGGFGASSALITTGTSIGGVAGSYPVCAADGGTTCASSAAFPAAATSGLAPKIITGGTVAGISGTSSGASANCTLDGQTSCITTSNEPAAKLANFTSANIQTGFSAAGVAGTFLSCSSDDQTGCVAVATYPAAATANIAATDLRTGKIFGGVNGALNTNCHNVVGTYNYDGIITSLPNLASTTGTAPDLWDTSDDFSGWTGTAVTGSTANTICNAAMWTDVTTTNAGATTTTCGAANCQYQDTASTAVISGILGGSASPTSYNWSAAVNACASSTLGGFAVGTWRLPTQKELMAFYDRGLVAKASANFASLTNLQAEFWTATTVATASTQAWAMTLASGAAVPLTKSGALYAMCVR